MLSLEKYSVEINNYFNQQLITQLTAFNFASDKGINVLPVLKRSLADHSLLGSTSAEFQTQVNKAIKASKSDKLVIISSDNITDDNYKFFANLCNLFTFSVSDFISKTASENTVLSFTKFADSLFGNISIEGLDNSYTSTEVQAFIKNYLGAIEEISRLYHKLLKNRGNDEFAVEISLEGLEKPLSVIETFFLLSAISIENIALQVFTPKFSGSFLRSVDFVGNKTVFGKELEQNILLIMQVQNSNTLFNNLKIGISSICDKPSVYSAINKVIKQYNCGIHLKTTAFSWLNDCYALSVANEDSLDFIKSVYAIAYSQIDKLTKPYVNILKINTEKLPTSAEMFMWNAEGMTAVLSLNNDDYNASVRQLMSISYNIALEYGDIFSELMIENKNTLEKYQSELLFDNLLKPIFIE